MAALIRARNRVLRWIGEHGSAIWGLNKSPEWDAATPETIIFHWIMKNPLRQAVRLMPDIPDRWMAELTGSQKLLYEIGKEMWKDCDRSQNRVDQFWKPFCFVLVLWHRDEVAEPFDRLLYEVLRRRDEFYISIDRQDPTHWYMDNNPKLPDKRGGRVMRIESEDPPVRFDTLNPDKVIVLLERPARNFVTLRNPDCSLYFVMLNRHEFIRPETGGYAFAVVGREDTLINASMHGQRIEEQK